MQQLLWTSNGSTPADPPQIDWRICPLAIMVALALGLSGCASPPPASEPSAPPTVPPNTQGSTQGSDPPPAVIERSQSRWVAVPWSALPGLEQDLLQEAWPAWLRSCDKPTPIWQALCPQVRALAEATPAARRDWLREKLQPYRVESHQGQSEGLLTAYYEPQLQASRKPQGRFTVPLYAPPAGLSTRTPWFTRQEIETHPQAKAALRGQALAYLEDPVDAMVLHIQGSGLLRVREPDGRVRTVRLAYAGTNGQPYQSIGRWLLEQGLTRDATWPGIKAWTARHPGRVQALLWQNPRYVFFREEALPAGEIPGPKGAQGVPLTAGRSIAVDPGSIPYGTPVWLASNGMHTTLEKLVVAQDTGAAITGAVRVDYYAGSGAQAGELAGRLKQPVRLWVLWPQ